MKNIINTSILLLLLISSAFSSNAEIFKVTVDGEEISNGSVASSSAVNKYFFAAGTLLLEPRVLVEILEPCHLAVTVENTTPGKSETVQFCWLGNCNYLNKGESLTKEHDFIWPDSQNLSIEAVVSDFNKEMTYFVASKVSIIANRDKESLFSFDLNMVYMSEDFAEVTTVSDIEEEAPVYYDLSGRIIRNPQKGIYIVRQGEKTYKVCL